MKMKFKIGDLVTVSKMDGVFESDKVKYIGGCWEIVKIDLLNVPWIYKVKFNNNYLKNDWFKEDELNFQ